MELTDLLNHALHLKQQLDQLRPLDPTTEQKILQKIRLDWNYHSNHIEGGQLSFGETKALILFGMTAQGKPLQDHLEMSGHDEAIKWIEEVVHNAYPITENFIRQLHEIILVKDTYKQAKTPDGQIIQRKIRIGAYKTVPNHVETKTGEIFYFAEPEETPAKMGDLMQWYHHKKEDASINPLLFAAEFHYRFIIIHPFDDGNGRLVRLLMNCILMQYGYPPAIIKTDDKENYYAALRQADAGIFEPFLKYIAQNVVASLELMLKGAKGESIEEPDDLDKAIALLEQKINHVGDKIEQVKSKEVLEAFILKNLPNIASTFIAIHDKMSKFYVRVDYNFEHFALVADEDQFGNPYLDNFGDIVTYPSTTQRTFDPSNLDEQIATVLKHSIKHLIRKEKNNSNSIFLTCDFNTFNRTDTQSFNYQQKLQLQFTKTHCVLKNNVGDTYSVLYHEDISDQVLTELLKKDVKQHLVYIQNKLAPST